MRFLIQCGVLLSTYLLIALFHYKTKQAGFENDGKVLRLHKAYLCVGIIATSIFAVLSIWSYIDREEIFSLLMFGFAVLSSALIFAYIRVRIMFDEERIICRNLFGDGRVFLWQDITSVRIGLDIELHFKNKKLVVRNYMTNQKAFMAMLAEKIPKRRKKAVQSVSKVRSFFDSVERPREFLAVFILLNVVFVALYAWFLISGFLKPRLDDYAFVGMTICVLAIFLVTFLCVHSAKRAHSSSFWYCVAKMMFKDGYLKK